MTADEDHYARTEYRRLIGWKSRLERERPFLEGLLAGAPERSVIDLGCGTGEHVAFFAGLGCRAVGLDSSPSMLEQAAEHERAGRGRFVLGDMVRAPEALAGEPPFGLCLCLGNVLPHLRAEADLDALFRGLGRLLLPGGLCLLQILNYGPLLSRSVRHLALNFQPDGEGPGEIVFLRLFHHVSEERILFFPTTLRFDPDAPEPVRVHASRRVEQRPWRAAELLGLLAARGFDARPCGDMRGGPFLPDASQDLVIVARRTAP